MCGFEIGQTHKQLATMAQNGEKLPTTGQNFQVGPKLQTVDLEMVENGPKDYLTPGTCRHPQKMTCLLLLWEGKVHHR